MSSAAKEQKHARHRAAVKKGRAYAGGDHEAEHPAYAMTSMGCIGGLGMLATNPLYRRMIRNTQRLQNLKEKMAEPVESLKGTGLRHRMN